MKPYQRVIGQTYNNACSEAKREILKAKKGESSNYTPELQSPKEYKFELFENSI